MNTSNGQSDLHKWTTGEVAQRWPRQGTPEAAALAQHMGEAGGLHNEHGHFAIHCPHCWVQFSCNNPLPGSTGTDQKPLLHSNHGKPVPGSTIQAPTMPELITSLLKHLREAHRNWIPAGSYQSGVGFRALLLEFVKHHPNGKDEAVGPYGLSFRAPLKANLSTRDHRITYRWRAGLSIADTFSVDGVNFVSAEHMTVEYCENSLQLAKQGAGY